MSLVVAWVVTTVAVTLWVTAKGDEVTAGNAMLVGVVAGTVLTAVLAKAKKG
jgi:hypothetical protein